MNYPFRNALIAYLLGGDADAFRETLETIRENYPPNAFYSLMNFLGTHDTPRILTVLGASHMPDSKEARAVHRLSPEERQLGLARLRLAALVLFTFPGSPLSIMVTKPEWRAGRTPLTGRVIHGAGRTRN